jgi:hypothetical protein
VFGLLAHRINAPRHDQNMYVFGGWDGRGGFYNDIAVYNIENVIVSALCNVAVNVYIRVQRTWSIAVTSGGEIEGRRHASLVVVQPHASTLCVCACELSRL